MVRVNFAEVEEFKPLPRGKYHFRVTDGEIKETSEESKHPGEDYWSLELTVQDGEQEGRTERTTCMLPPAYQPYTLVSILRATVGQHEWSEEEVESGEFDVELEDLMDLEFVASVRPQKGNPDFNNVSRFEKYDEENWTASDLLP